MGIPERLILAPVEMLTRFLEWKKSRHYKVMELPEDFPVFPGSILEEKVRDGKGALGLWSSDQPRQEIVDFFLESLPSAGFAVERVDEFAQATELRFVRADGSGDRGSEIDVSGQGLRTTILVMIGHRNDPITQYIR
jgi:hypothetical protein